MIGVYCELLAGLLVIVCGTFRERREWIDYREMVPIVIWLTAVSLDISYEAAASLIVNVTPDGEVLWLNPSEVPVPADGYLSELLATYRRLDPSASILDVVVTTDLHRAYDRAISNHLFGAGSGNATLTGGLTTALHPET